MSQWKNTTPGYRSKTIQVGGATVIIHRPELTKEEQKKREKDVLHALASVKGGVAV